MSRCMEKTRRRLYAMSGGRLVVLDRLRRDVKAYLLEAGLARIGSDPACDIRIMLPTVSPHHATIVVHTNQTVVRSVSVGETLVNGEPVSVAALRHKDEVIIGGRTLRWEYNEPNRPRPLSPQPALGRRTASGARGAQRRSHPSVHRVLVPEQRASMPGSSGKQVAIVQPQRRETSDKSAPASATAPARGARSRRATLSRSSNKSQPLLVPLLRGAVNMTKIQAPSKIDHTKQAAIMLMTGHTSKDKPSKPGFVPKRPSPIRRTPKAPKTTAGTRKISKGVIGATPKRTSAYSSRKSEASKTASIIEITDSDTPRTTTRRSGRHTAVDSPSLLSLKKSSLKDPAKKLNRKTESIKFDLSNLQGDGQELSSDVMLTQECSYNSASYDDMTLHYTDTSPSPTKSIHSRSIKILGKSLGTTYTQSPVQSEMSSVISDSSPARKSLRGSLIVQKALENTDSDLSSYSHRSTKTMSEQSFNTVTSARKTRTLSPRTSQNIESYSIVDLVSINSNESAPTMYNSMDSNSASLKFGTPQNERKTRSYDLVGSSTPYSKSKTSNNSILSPTGTKQLSKKEVLFVEGSTVDSSTSRSKADADSPGSGSRTPIICIQRLLNQSSSTRGKRKTLPAAASSNKKPKSSVKSRSLSIISRSSQRATKFSPPQYNQISQDEEIVTPKSAVKLVQEGVKNKHSTARKPTSKRSIIDDLHKSDFVKQLFNSPVKRKLSRSMTEFSRKELFEVDEVAPLKHKRNTIAVTGTTTDNSLFNDTEAFTPEVFISPMSSPGNSPNLSGIRRLFRKNTPENDLRNVRGVKALLRTPRNRNSVRNDLTSVSGVKKIFEKSPINRLSDVRVKEVFTASPNNDLRQVSGVRSLFQGNKGKTSKNTLEDIRGVKYLFRSGPRNDLSKVSGVKKILSRNSPRNDLTEVRGVKELYREQEERNNLSDLSGVEKLFYEPSNLDSTFDLLVGKPRVRSYRKAKSFSKVNKHTKPARNAKTLHYSIGSITNNVEEWLENELKKRTYNKPIRKKSVTRSNLTRELEKLSTDTIEGSTPLRTTRVRNNTSIAQESRADNKTVSELYSAHKLPIKKRRLLHSTPVKGGGAAANDTIGARELGRDSPIQLLKPHYNSPGAKPNNRRGKVKEVVTAEVLEPRRTRRKPISSPPPDRKTNAKNRRSSIVVKKKPPALIPKPTPKEEKVKVDVKKSPIKRNSTRQKRQVQPKIDTPKVARAKEVSSVIALFSQQNPRPTRNIKKKEPVEVKEVKTRRSRKITNNATSDKNAEKIESAPEQGVQKRGRKAEIITDEVTQKPVKRGRKNITAIATKEARAGTKDCRTRAITNTKTLQRLNNTKDKENEPLNKSSKRTRQNTEVEESVAIKNTTRGRSAKNNNIAINEKKNSLKEKATATDVKSVEKVPPKTRRCVRTGTNEENGQIEGKRKEKKKQTNKINESKKTRNTVKEVEVKPTRGGKVTIIEEQEDATNEVKRGRKRKAESVEPPAEVAAVGEKKRRATRATQTETAQRSTSRSRRR